MASSQTEIESQIIELAEKSFKTFCGDISDMFGMDMDCNRQEVKHETVDDLQMRFENLAVVYSVKYESAKDLLDGTFQMLFDRKGLFILAGVVAMQPGEMILEDITTGSLKKAEKASNVLNEVGTALVGSWDRVFRKGLDDHGRFVLTDTFIGNPWDKAEEKIGLNSDEELVFVPYDMTICPYPTFKCCAIFPRAIFAAASESGTEQSPPAEESAAAEQPQPEAQETTGPEEGAAAEQPQPQAQETAESGEGAAADQPQQQAQETTEPGEGTAPEQPQSEAQEPAESGEGAAAEQPQPEAQETAETEGSAAAEQPQQQAQETAEPGESAAAGQPQPQAQEAAETEGSAAAGQPQPQAQEAAEHEDGAAADQPQPGAVETAEPEEIAAEQEPEAAVGQEPSDVEGETATISETDIAQERPISDAIKKMARSATVLPGESAPSAMAEEPGSKDALLTVYAKDIMQKEVVWAKPDDTVQQALSMMQQHNTGYIMVGRDNVPEGIVSNSDLNGALSPYLRNIFAKWRRPLDDATLQIKVKWIMSKPTCTISLQTSLVKIMENMCRTEKKCLPVLDDKGKVRGMVTVFDIFRALIKHSCPG